MATCRRHAAALINGVLQGVQSNLGSFRKSRPLCLVGLHVAIEARNKRRLAGVFLDFDLVELEAPLPATVVILVTVDLENRCPLILVAFGLEPRVEASPKVGMAAHPSVFAIRAVRYGEDRCAFPDENLRGRRPCKCGLVIVFGAVHSPAQNVDDEKEVIARTDNGADRGEQSVLGLIIRKSRLGGNKKYVRAVLLWNFVAGHPSWNPFPPDSICLHWQYR